MASFFSPLCKISVSLLQQYICTGARKVTYPADHLSSDLPGPDLLQHRVVGEQLKFIRKRRQDGRRAGLIRLFRQELRRAVLAGEGAPQDLITEIRILRQHRPVKPDGTDRCAFPIRLDVPAQLRDNLIYRQPEFEAAVASGQTVYIVEGEKDADTMWRLGLAATTNAGGGT